MSSYLRPTKIEQALSALTGGGKTIIAGGTDIYPARVGQLIEESVVDVTAIDGLRVIENRGDHYFIGAAATWTDLIRAELPEWFNGMKMAAREVGGVQIQNAGTIVGNICNASPAADGFPGLLTLNATVKLASTNGERFLPIDEFVLGNRNTARKPDEMVLGLQIPALDENSKGTFIKLGARKYLVISIVMVSAILTKSLEGKVKSFRIAVGSCSEVAKRLTLLEEDLIGKTVKEGLCELVTPDHLSMLKPIDDIRGTADYRNDVSLTLVRRAISELTG